MSCLPLHRLFTKIGDSRAHEELVPYRILPVCIFSVRTDFSVHALHHAVDMDHLSRSHWDKDEHKLNMAFKRDSIRIL